MKKFILILILYFFSCLREYSQDNHNFSDLVSDTIFDTGYNFIEDVQSIDISGDAGKFLPIKCNRTIIPADKSLREKAEFYDRIARELHIPEGQELIYSVFVKEDGKSLDRVIMSDNVGTWTAIYTASQAFRYAETKSDEALKNLRHTLKGEYNLMKITGVKGLFTRVYVNPDIYGFPTGEQLEKMYPDCDLSVKHCKRFVEVKDGEFKGYWFKTDVSKDEYAHHMFAMSIVWQLIDDEEIRRMVKEIVLSVADHLMENNLRITDIDGRTTTYGRMYATAMDDFPGFNALLILSWFKLAAIIGGGKYKEYYQNCLLQKNGRYECIKNEEPAPYTDYLNNVGLNLDCKTNWNNHNMAQISIFHLIQNEEDTNLNSFYRQILKNQLWDAEDKRPMRIQQNTLYTFFYAINRSIVEPIPDKELSDGICVMQIFPADKHQYKVDTLNRYPIDCYDRSDEPMTDIVIPVNEYGIDNFLWIRNPYKLKLEEENRFLIESPEDYLLAYWLGRFYGFISEDM